MAKEVGAGEFFDLIFGSSPDPGYVTLASYPNGKFDPDPSKGPTDQLWFEWPAEREELIATVRKYSSLDLYYCPAVFRSESGGRKADNIQWLGVHYADADLAQPESFRVRPSISVHTSPNKHHLYWILGNPGTPQEIAHTNRVMAYSHAEQGCDLSGWSPAKLLRVPGTANNKPGLGQPFGVEAFSDGTVYTSEDIIQHYPNDTELREPGVWEGVPKELPDYDEAMSAVAHLNKVAELLRVHGRAPANGEPGNRSQLMWLLLRELAEQGISREIAFVLGWEVHYNKYRASGRSKSEYWKEVCKAFTKLGVGEDEAPTQIPVRKRPRVLPVHLLTEVERRNVSATIMDQYVGWAATKTDAARQYHEAAILTILGCVFGEYGKPSTKFESGFLNQWFMVLGGTTMSRKSTVKSMMTRFLRHINDKQFFYDLGSNVTPEGLHNELLERDGLSSLFHRDEVHGMFSEQKHKHYLAGLTEMMTELYDGNVQGKLRATGGHTKSRSVDTAFNMYLTGVTDHVTEALGLEDFKSGHLARFLFVHADPPEITRETSRIEQAEEVEDSNGLFVEESDRPYELLLDQVRQAREWWGSKVKRGKQVKIFWEKDAWERLNDARYKAFVWANSHKHKEVLSATMQRSMHQVLKIATLLAMSERCVKVQVRHLIRALKFAEQCFADLVLILDRVTATNRTKILDEIVEMVLTSGEGGISSSKLYNRFRNDCTMGEFTPMVQDLQAAGQLRVEQQRVYPKELV